MSILLGIDTGGTFTDAVLIESGSDGLASLDKGQVIAKAKSLTVKSDLARGIAGSIEKVLTTAQVSAEQVSQVSLSTTLATIALVEGHGGHAALVLAGFSEPDVGSSGLARALGNDPVLYLSGAHDTYGRQSVPLDLAPLISELGKYKNTVDGFAVAGYFAVRNPDHELQIRDFLQQATGLPVTCSHELSDQLDGPKRALTTLLNARLIAMTVRLVSATRQLLVKKGISCPLMVVRGNGSLVSADFAMRRPIETILSGPAASLVGARWLTGADNAFVSDIGGTTTDIAVLDNGRPKLDPDGARIGAFQTMVEAVAMNTFGLGGDSEITLEESGLDSKLVLGPARVMPVCLLAIDHQTIVYSTLERQLHSALRGRYDGRFAMLSGITPNKSQLGPSELHLLSDLALVPQPLDKLLSGHSRLATLLRLVRGGYAAISAITPTDAMHVLGEYDAWDKEAAIKAVTLFARQKNSRGQPVCASAEKLAGRIKARLIERSAKAILTAGFREDGLGGKELDKHLLVDRALNQKTGMVQFGLTLDRPVIGLGASAHQFIPGAAAKLAVDAIIPEHADVANAIGAVVGQIEVSFSITINQPEEGRFGVSGSEHQIFSSLDEAKSFAELQAGNGATKLAVDAGATEFETVIEYRLSTAEIEGRDMFVEAHVKARTTGRPAFTA